MAKGKEYHSQLTKIEKIKTIYLQVSFFGVMLNIYIPKPLKRNCLRELN